MNYNEEYSKSIEELEKMLEKSSLEIEGWDNLDEETIDSIASNLDGFDYCFSIAFGLVGAFISTNKELEEYLNEIHKIASEASNEGDFLQRFLGKLLNHKGDNIDQIGNSFINRNGESAYGLFHRLLWGHDPLSFGADNPFSLMFKQKGLKGIVQALRHLLADTMSHQGLPFPGSSYLDYTKGDGKISNYLIKISQKLSLNSYGDKRHSEEIYSNIFTIKMQDVMGGGAITALNTLYFKIRGIDDDTRKTQFRLIAYSVGLMSDAIVGAVRQGGVPYFNIHLFALVCKNFVQLYYYSNKETNKLKQKTILLIKEDDEIERQVLETDKFIRCYETTEEYINEIERGQKNVDDLIDFFEEG